MPGRYFSWFASLDFFGKSMPGVVLSLLLVSILPIDLPTTVLQERSALALTTTEVIILLIGVIVFGFVAGQSLHTVAVLVEKTIYSAGRVVRRCGTRIWTMLDPDWRTPSGDRTDVGRWLGRRYDGVSNAFKPHRQLFEERITGYQQSDKDDKLLELFFDRVNDEFGVSMANRHDFSMVYPLVMSRLNEWEDNRAGRFQSSYTFCRGMWVILIAFGVVYLSITNTGSLSRLYATGTEPIVIQVLPTSLVFTAAIAMMATASIFMYSAGIYRQYFVEYIFADFINAARTAP